MTDGIITFLASFLIWFMFAGLIILWVIDGRIKKEEALHAIVAFILAWVVADIIKLFFPTLRPFIVNGAPSLTLFPEHNGAFPSGHSSAAFALAVTIWLHDRKLGWIYILLALIVGTARVLANVHYPVDILGGAVVGILTAFLVERVHLFKLLGRIKKGLDI